jgi:FkbM family methyltransferase
MLPRWSYPVLQGPLRGARFVLGSLAGEGGGASVYFGAVEREQTTSLVATLRPGNVFFDIGANVGYYSILGSRLVGPRGRVIALEPAVRNIALLYQHITINRTANVRIVPAACADRLSIARFSGGENFATGHISESDAGGAIVPTITVDALTKIIGLPDVIKIDVEGAEADVLRGASETFACSAPVIYLSVHSSDLRSRCLALLATLGYVASPLRTDEPEPTEYRAVRGG